MQAHGDDDTPERRRRRVRATAALCALALCGGLVVTLAHAQPRRTGTNDVTVSGVVDTLTPGHRLCQDEPVPAGTDMLRLPAVPAGRTSPGLSVELRDASTAAPIARGRLDAWSSAPARIPLRPRVARDRRATICLRIAGSGRADVLGGPARGGPSATDDGRRLGGVVHFDYLRADAQSWWSFAPTVVTRLGRGRAWSETAAVAAAIAAGLLMLTSVLLAGWLLARRI